MKLYQQILINPATNGTYHVNDLSKDAIDIKIFWFIIIVYFIGTIIFIIVLRKIYKHI